ncbi:MAG: amidohydrolase [Schaedlerella sp.]|nr:amidohydrolase [Schaedlerella sp.]
MSVMTDWFLQHESEMKEIAKYIFEHPEIAMKEEKSSKRLADYLEKAGFEITWNIAGLETAFVAEWGEGETIIGFLAEYDALPGLGQPILANEQRTGEPGHGCGHNLLGTACAGAAIALKEWMENEKIEGVLRVYGCPAEEIVYGKIKMNNENVFDDLSVAVTWHPFDRNRVSYDIWQAQDIKHYNFYGVSAHASKYPELGRSALDAAELMNVGVNYLREHVAEDVRMHYAYTSPQGAANIVPAFASTKYFIRASKAATMEDASERVDNCAKGAALMTGTKVEIETIVHHKEMKVNRVLAECFYHAMENITTPQYTDEEIAFAEELSKEAGFDNDGIYFTGLESLETEPVRLAIGTDVSDMSHTVPTIMLSAATMCKGTPLHHWTATVQSGMSIGYKGMMYAAECMTEGCIELLKNPGLIEKAWEMHREK